jgi:hypothetical protein
LYYCKKHIADDLVIFHKFADNDSQIQFSELLTNLGIANTIQNNNHAYVVHIGYREIDIPYGINIRQSDFPKAEKLLEAHYTSKIPEIDKGYYLFNESNDFLMNIIRTPYDWGILNLVLAKHILLERGVEIKDDDIAISKLNQVNVEKKIKSANKILIVIGFILSKIIPFLGFIIGVSVYYNRKLLKNGERFYVHPETDRKHGKNIMIISAAATIVYLLLTFRKVVQNAPY